MTSISTFVEKEGYLWVKRHPTVPTLKAWQWKYFVLKKCSGYQYNVCLEWYENRDAFLADSSPKKMKFDLIKLVGNLDDKKKAFAFVIYTSSINYDQPNYDQLQLATKTEEERVEWTDTFNRFTRKEGRSCSVPTSIDAPYMYKFPKPQSLPLNVDASKTSYQVKFQHSTVSPGSLKTKGDYLLQVGPKHVSLWTISGKEPQRNLLYWSLATIKSYDSRPVDGNPNMKLLIIETGRQSSTGSGDFHFLTPFGDEIKNNIRLNTKRTYFEKKKHSSECITLDHPCNSSPESSSPKMHSYRMPSDPTRRTSVKSPDRVPIPFEEYDEKINGGEESFATYIPHENGYIHVLTPQEDVDKFQRFRESTSGHELLSGIPDDGAYLKVLSEDEPNEHPVYLTILGEDEENIESQEGDGKEARIDGNRGSETQFVSLGVNTESISWFSQTSQQSSVDYSSVSSENDVFNDRHASISDVFHDDIARFTEGNRTFSEKNNNELKSASSDSCTSANCDDDSQDPREKRASGDQNPRGERASGEQPSSPELDIGNDWHNGVGGEGHDDSTSSASDGAGNVHDSPENSEEEAANSDGAQRRNSLPRQSFSGVKSFDRQRSFTTNDLQDLLKRVEIAQDYFLTGEEFHRDTELQNDDPLGLGLNLQNTIVDQLTNPTAAQQSRNSYPRRNSPHSAGEIKYLCSECGWYKRSRKKSVLKKEKKCERCSRVIQKSNYSAEQKDPKSPKKDKSIRLLSRLTRKLTDRSSSENIGSTRDEFRPTKPIPQQSFLKNLNAHVTSHNQTLDGRRSEFGIAPSTRLTLTALSISGESRTTAKTSTPVPNENTLSPQPKTPLTGTKSEGAISSGAQISPKTPTKSPRHHPTLTKSLTCDLGKLSTNPLTRTLSSPICNEPERSPEYLAANTRHGDEIPPRKLSGGNLPTLPENGTIESADPPPAIPPRTREEPPPVPPRRNPTVPAKIRRAQTDPCDASGRNSPVLLESQPAIGRALTDPGCEDLVQDKIHKTGLQGGKLNGEEGRYEGKTSLTNNVPQPDGDCLDNLALSTPPPLPPRKISLPLPSGSPRRASDETDRLHRSLDQGDSSGFMESPKLPENGSPGRPKVKPPLTTKRSLDAKRNFKSRNPVYSERVDCDDINPDM